MMENDNTLRFVPLTPEDYKYIEELYEKISGAYNSMNSSSGIKPTFRKNRQHIMIKYAVRFLRQHANYGDKDIQNFAAMFIEQERCAKNGLK